MSELFPLIMKIIFLFLRLMIFLLTVSRWLTPRSLSLNGLMWKKTYHDKWLFIDDVIALLGVFFHQVHASMFPSFSACFSIFLFLKWDKVSKEIQLKLFFTGILYVFYNKKQVFVSQIFVSLCKGRSLPMNYRDKLQTEGFVDYCVILFINPPP